VKQWTEVMRYIRATDPYHRLLTVHPTGIGRLSARHATDDSSLLDFDMLQTPHGQRDACEPTVNTVRESYADKPVMPVLDGEAAYEMLNDSLPTEWTRAMFWLSLTNGAAGHTYGANGIWQCNRPGEPHGPSPHHNGGVGYGVIPWNEAMNLPGSRQVGLGKKLFERFAWQEFSPHADWAAYADDQPAKFGPFATGKAGEARIVYALESRPVKLMQLNPGVKYDVQAFDPVTGETTAVESVGGDKADITVSKPVAIKSDDWVIVVERAK
jgi:hypothetical protein